MSVHLLYWIEVMGLLEKLSITASTNPCGVDFYLDPVDWI